MYYSEACFGRRLRETYANRKEGRRGWPNGGHFVGDLLFVVPNRGRGEREKGAPKKVVCPCCAVSIEFGATASEPLASAGESDAFKLH